MNEEQKLKQLREQLPSVTEQVFLNTGTCGPVPRQSHQAFLVSNEREFLRGRASIQGYIDFFGELEALRSRLASLLGTEMNQLALTSSTTEGMNVVLNGIRWQPGDQIITSTHEHPGLLAPLSMLHTRFGVEILYIDLTGDPVVDCQRLADAFGKKTKMLAISHISFLDGTVYPVKELTEYCHDKGACVLVDGAQSFGAMPLDLEELGADFYAAPAQKWACGPEGLGWLYVSSRWMSRLLPSVTGIFSVHNVSWFDQCSPYLVPSKGARRFEYGGFHRPLISAMEASLDFLEKEAGWSWLWKRNRALTKTAVELLSQTDVLSIVSRPDRVWNLLSFRLEKGDSVALRDWMGEQGIILREVPGEPPLIRISLGFYNSISDIERLLDALKQWKSLPSS